ncbi:hypothetical protein AUP68_06632 [Ilyonectria robusta]
MSSEPIKTCIFFMDNSNIWIRAQKLAASGNGNMPKLRGGDSDPRLRIRIGKLVDMLRNDRFQGPSFLYGSGLRPDSSVLEEYSKFNFQSKIYDRYHGAEKEVDTSMAADLGYEAAKLTFEAKPWNVRQQKANTTFVITTGDRDMLPPVKKVLDCGIRVELWAWKSGASSDYLKLQSQNPLLSVRYLDCLFEEISFMNFHSTRDVDEFDPGKTIILCCSDMLRREDLESSICKQLVEFRYLFYITISKTGEDIIVEFPGIESIEGMIVKIGISGGGKRRSASSKGAITAGENAGMLTERKKHGAQGAVVKVTSLQSALIGDGALWVAYRLSKLALNPFPTYCLRVQRLGWKSELIAKFEDRLVRDPLPLPPTIDPDAVKDFDFRRVYATGHFRHDQEMLVGPRMRDGTDGFMVVTPLERKGGSTILVNRGWIDKKHRNRRSRPDGLPTGEVTVEGLLREPWKKNMFTPENRPERGDFFFPDVKQMAELTGSQPVWVEATMGMSMDAALDS